MTKRVRAALLLSYLEVMRDHVWLGGYEGYMLRGESVKRLKNGQLLLYAVS